MKNLIKLISLLAVLLQLTACGNYPDSAYTVVLPEVPYAWISLLGEPHWRIEWLDSNGLLQKKDIQFNERLVINLPVTWVNPVIAYPYWPRIFDSEHSLIPGLFKPAGGLFYYDASGNQINLSWEAGPDAVYYMEMTLANSDNEARLPAYFDWNRFRELFKSDVLNESVRKDPWLVNWKSVAERTIASGFDRRRITAESPVNMEIPAGTGPWFGTSPFADPLIFNENETPVFPVRSGVNVWISEEGILRVSGSTWVLTEIRR